MGDDIVWSAWRHAADVWCLYAGDEMEEIWKPYIEGYYEASTLGNIRSVDREVLLMERLVLGKALYSSLLKTVKVT